MNLAAHTRPVLLALLVVSVWRPAHGETIYKSVDSEGRVTYSSTPPPSGSRVEKLMLPSSPSEQDIRQARELAQRVETQGRQLESKRLEQEAAKKAEEERLRALQPPPPVVIEKPVYVPRAIYYPPVIERPPARPPRPPNKPRPVPDHR